MNELWLFYSLIHCETQLEKTMTNIALKFLVFLNRINIYYMKLPKSWNKISLNTFSKLSNIKDTDNDITNLINRLVVLTGEPIEKVEQLKYGQVMKLTKRLSYLNELPTAKKYYRTMNLNNH